MALINAAREKHLASIVPVCSQNLANEYVLPFFLDASYSRCLVLLGLQTTHPNCLYTLLSVSVLLAFSHFQLWFLDLACADV